MIAAQDTEMTDTAKTLYDKNQDEYARNWALAREMFLFEERCRKAREKKALAELEEARKENAELKKETSKTKNEVSKAKDEASKAKSEASKAKKENERLRALLAANGIDPDA
jgi:septal ring factor EnvC (AmiA/AmiB activator)